MRSLTKWPVVVLFVAEMVMACGTSDSAGDDGTFQVTGQGGMVAIGGGGTGAGTGGILAGAGGAGRPAQGGATVGNGGTTAAAGSGGGMAEPLADWKAPGAKGADPFHIDAAYQTWRNDYFVDCGAEAYVLKDDTADVVSEGIAYGMLLAANVGKSEDFSKLWAYYKARRNGNGVMNWNYPAGCGQTGAKDQGGATDAELDAAMALLIAAKNGWDAGYSTDAMALIAAIKQYETTTCDGRTVLKPGDAWGGCGDTNPSYFSPGYYRVFGQVTGDAAFWTKLATDSYWLLTQYQNKMNGAVPDWGQANGSIPGQTRNSAANGKYGYDACRTPWRIALDYGWFLDTGAKAFLQTMHTQFIGEGASPYGAGGTDTNSAFVGALALVGIAVDQKTTDYNFRQWYDAAYLGDDHYFQATLKVVYLITIGGRFSSSL